MPLRKCEMIKDKSYLTEHNIEIGNASPIKHFPRRLPNALQQGVEEQVRDMLRNEVIKHSNLPWASPFVLVRKKDCTWHFCVKCRKVNDTSVQEAYPLPHVSDLTLCLIWRLVTGKYQLKTVAWRKLLLSYQVVVTMRFYIFLSDLQMLY